MDFEGMSLEEIAGLDFEGMSLEELGVANQVLMGRRREVLEIQRAINEAMSEKAAAEAARAKTAGMSDAEKAALLQVLQPEGIASGEKVGRPGG